MSLATMTADLARPRVRPIGGALEEGVAPTDISSKDASNKAFDALARFIPTEVLAPFIMAMQYASEVEVWNEKVVYWSFLFATPVLLIVFEYARTASSNDDWPDKRHLAWRAIAAGAAFAVWGLSVPGNTYQDMLGGIAFTGLMAVLISPILTAIDAIVLRIIRDLDAKKRKRTGA